MIISPPQMVGELMILTPFTPCHQSQSSLPPLLPWGITAPRANWVPAALIRSHLSTMFKFYALSAQFILVTLLLIGVAACGADPVETPVPATATPLPATATTVPTTVPAAADSAAVTSTVSSTATQSVTATATPELADILVILARAEGMERFATVAEEVGLAEQLAGAGPFTVFVPPTSAWAELPAAITGDPELMRQILLDHIVEGQTLMPDLIAAGKTTSLGGDELTLLAGEEGATVQGTNVLGADFIAKNGVIHIIDTVILPPALADKVMALYPTVVGEQTYPMQGNIHIANGKSSPVAYNSAPPTSGPHYPNIVAWQVYAEPFRYEQLVHNLEDSGVIIYYQCAAACPELVAELNAVVQPFLDGGRHVVVVPNDPTWTMPDGDQPHTDMGAPFVVTAWRKLLKLETVDAEKIGQFIETYEGIDHHVK